MIYGLYLSANGLITQGMRADAIANNLANASTHGFKRDFLSLRQRDPEVLRQGGPLPTTQKHLLAIGGAVEGDRTFSIFSQGAMQKTDGSLDLAINGEGLFKFGDPEGNTYYSRAGALTLDSERYLVGPNGFKILTRDGESIQVESDNFHFDETGRIYSENEEVAQIAVVKVDRPENLHKSGENFFEAQGELTEQDSDAQLKPGFLETSSVSAVKEMTAMIEAMRAYEANSRFIRAQDETLGKAISQIAL